MATPEECAERREKLARACEREGREPIPLSLMRAARSDATRRGAGADPAPARARRPADRPGRVQGTTRQAAILGTLEEAAEQLRAYERAGVERVMLQHLDHSDLEMVELIGRELAPAVA